MTASAEYARRRDRERFVVDRAVTPREFLGSDWMGFLRSDPGTPLGISGSSLREDGESHREAWMRVIRADPCSYCRGPGGTVDHVEPKTRPGPLVHTWINYSGACERCNGSKKANRLLDFLLRVSPATL